MYASLPASVAFQSDWTFTSPPPAVASSNPFSNLPNATCVLSADLLDQ